MQFSSKEDIEATPGEVFALLSDFEGYERAATRRGIDVERLQDTANPAVGMAWNVMFTIRGKPRSAEVTLGTYDKPNVMRFETESQGIDGFLDLELVPLSSRRTRLSVVLNLKPRTMTGRLLIQSLKLAKSSLTKRFKLKVADYARELEDRNRRLA